MSVLTPEISFSTLSTSCGLSRFSGRQIDIRESESWQKQNPANIFHLQLFRFNTRATGSKEQVASCLLNLSDKGNTWTINISTENYTNRHSYLFVFTRHWIAMLSVLFSQFYLASISYCSVCNLDFDWQPKITGGVFMIKFDILYQKHGPQNIDTYRKEGRCMRTYIVCNTIFWLIFENLKISSSCYPVPLDRLSFTETHQIYVCDTN